MKGREKETDRGGERESVITRERLGGIKRESERQTDRGGERESVITREKIGGIKRESEIEGPLPQPY